MEQAIKKAIEGGWRPTFNSLPHLHPKRDWQHIVSDVLFWQSLGKQQGWIDCKYEQETGKVRTGRPVAKVHRRDWLRKWHSFIDHIAEGGDIDEFFNQLIK